MSSVDLPVSMLSVPSFFGAPIGDIEDLSEGKIAVAGLFCDHFSAGEPGARYAARQLRYASLPVLTHRPNIAPANNIIDVGELNIFPIEPQKTLSILKEQSFRIHQTGAKLLTLGGDYSLIPALVSGQLQARPDRDLKIIRISRNLDAAEIPNPQKKPLSRSCATRQLGEHCGGSKSITLLGVSDSNPLEEFEYLADSFVRSAHQLSTSLSGLTEQLLNGLPDKNVSFYLSVDIDVLALPSIRSNSAYTGTGLTPKQLTSLILELGKLPIIGADVTGYIPDLDISGSSASVTVAEIVRSVIETMSQESVLCR
ncbi:arginase family protein [Candidatus Njordibacter sp. Uisw_039]|jgi:arginase family enzyme|uniref:arginase family protein n=1 Tax=Candidatus Njordibacter sp. Uisw_039 TaxID=3230972 RepID=UPI003D5C744E